MGKLTERWGRKATGLRGKPRTAGLPMLGINSHGSAASGLSFSLVAVGFWPLTRLPYGKRLTALVRSRWYGGFESDNIRRS